MVIQMVEKLVLKVEKPHFVVKLHEDILEVDLKEGAKKELEDVVEAHRARIYLPLIFPVFFSHNLAYPLMTFQRRFLAPSRGPFLFY